MLQLFADTIDQTHAGSRMALRAQVSAPSAPWSVCPQAHATVREELVLNSLANIQCCRFWSYWYGTRQIQTNTTPLQNIKTNITHSLQSTLIFATSYQPQRTHTTTKPILSLTRKHTLHALTPHKNNVLISLWHFRAIEQVLLVGEMAPAVTGPPVTLLLTPDHEEEFPTCYVSHNATFVLEP